MINRIIYWVVVWIADRLPPCDVICKRLSDARDVRPPFKERIVNRLHLIVCVWCTSYHKQIALVDEAMARILKEAAHDLGEVRHRLSDDARSRISRAIEDAI